MPMALEREHSDRARGQVWKCLFVCFCERGGGWGLRETEMGEEFFQSELGLYCHNLFNLFCLCFHCLFFSDDCIKVCGGNCLDET